MINVKSSKRQTLSETWGWLWWSPFLWPLFWWRWLSTWGCLCTGGEGWLPPKIVALPEAEELILGMLAAVFGTAEGVFEAVAVFDSDEEVFELEEIFDSGEVAFGG